jgi:hypothetical protein
VAIGYVMGSSLQCIIAATTLGVTIAAFRCEGRLDLRDVDLTSELVAARNVKQTSECDVLVDHHREFRNLTVVKLRSKLGFECRVDAAEVESELFGKANCKRFARLEFALGFGEVDLRNRLFVESFTRRRRVACKQSGVAFVEFGDFETGQLFDARRDNALLVPRVEKRRPMAHEFGDRLLQVEGGCDFVGVGCGHPVPLFHWGRKILSVRVVARPHTT